MQKVSKIGCFWLKNRRKMTKKCTFSHWEENTFLGGEVNTPKNLHCQGVFFKKHVFLRVFFLCRAKGWNHKNTILMLTFFLHVEFSSENRAFFDPFFSILVTANVRVFRIKKGAQNWTPKMTKNESFYTRKQVTSMLHGLQLCHYNIRLGIEYYHFIPYREMIYDGSLDWKYRFIGPNWA